MSAPRTASSAFIGTAWFAVLLTVCMFAKDWTLPSAAAPQPTGADLPNEQQKDAEYTTRRLIADVEQLLTARSSGNPVDQPLDVLPPTEPAQAQPSTTARSLVPASQPELADPTSRPGATGPRLSAPPAVPDQSTIPVLPRPDSLDVPQAFDFAVEPPEIVREQETALFVLRVTNPGSAPTQAVTVRADFDDGWEFPDSDQRSIEQRMGEVAPKSTREVSLSLTPLRAGRSRIDFHVESQTHPPATETTWVDVQSRSVELTLAGPRRRSVGHRAEFVATIVNTSGNDLPQTRAEFSYDSDVLAVREASVGWTTSAGTIAWPLGTLLREERVQIQLEFECTSETPPAPIRCTFQTAGQLAALREAPLEVIPPRPVEVTIVDHDDPHGAGDSVRFSVHVHNRTTAPLADLELRISTSPHFADLELADDSRSTIATVAQDPYGIDLKKVAIPADGHISISASARASRPGDGVLRVLVRAPSLPAPFEVEESLVVNPAPPTVGQAMPDGSR